MKEKIIEVVKELFEADKIDGFVAPKGEGPYVAPYVFTDPEELDQLNLGEKDQPGDARYSLVGLLTRLAEERPQARLAVLVRGCDERALDRIMADSRRAALNPVRTIRIGFSCPPELARACQCSKPWPDALVAGEKTPGVDGDQLDQSSSDPMLQLAEWFEIFNRCVKCFGCRNVCPVCDCRECTMECEPMVPQRELPIDPSFLLTRAVHMADRCVYCGLCEEACPADIPLKSLYRLTARILGLGGMLPGAEPMPPRPLDFFGQCSIPGPGGTK